MANKTQHKIELTALDKTKKAFNSVKSGLGKIKGATLGVTKVLGASALAFTGVATAVGLATKQSFDFIDAIGKTSLRTGIAVDSLQSFIIAAQESGSSTEEATKGFEKFARSIGDAERGLKTQLDIFTGLGVELRDGTGAMRSTEDILMDVADGVKNLGSESERATVLANLFGRAGMKFSEIFRDGAAGLESFTRKAIELGIVLDADIVNNVQQFNDSFNILTNQFNSLKNNVLGAFAPVLLAITEDISKLFTAVGDGEEDVDGLKKRFKELGEEIATNLINGLADAIDSFGEITVAMMKFGKETQIVVLQTQRLLNATNPVKFAAFTVQIKATRKEIEQLENPFTEAANKVRKYGENIGKVSKSQIALTSGVEKTKDAVEEQSASLINIAEPLDVYRDSLNKIDKAIDQSFVDAFKKAEDTLVQFVQTGKLNFKELVDSIIADIIRLSIRQRLIAPLFGFLFPAATTGSDTTTATSTGGNPFTNMGGLPDFNNGGFTGMGARVGGIDGKGGFPAILHPNETVVDHTKGQSMGSTNINFTIQATDTSGFDQLLTSRKNQIVAMISQAMNQRGKTGLI